MPEVGKYDSLEVWYVLMMWCNWKVNFIYSWRRKKYIPSWNVTESQEWPIYYLNTKIFLWIFKIIILNSVIYLVIMFFLFALYRFFVIFIS